MILAFIHVYVFTELIFCEFLVYWLLFFDVASDLRCICVFVGLLLVVQSLLDDSQLLV